MRVAKFFIMMLIATAALTACKKDSSSSSDKAIEGKWVGKYGFDNEAPSEFYSFNIKPGGILEEIGQTGLKIGEGTWKLENNIFTGVTYSTLGSNSKYSVIAAYDQAKGKLLGDWGFDDSATDGGTWEMTKQ